MIKTFLILAALVGYSADVESQALEGIRAIRSQIDALMPQAMKDGKHVAEIVAQIEALEEQEKPLETIRRQASRQKELEKVPAEDRYNEEFGDSGNEFKKFSLTEVLRMAKTGRSSSLTNELAELARKEFSDSNVSADVDIAIPRQLMTYKGQQLARYRNATQSVGGANLGSQYVSTDLRMDFLSPAAQLPLPALQMAGATILSGLRGNIDLPRYTPPNTPLTVRGENGTAQEINFVSGKNTLTPNRLAAHCPVTDQLLMQSDLSVEMMIYAMLLEHMAVEKDKLALAKLVATIGIGAVVGGVNGAAPTEQSIIRLETAVANANASASGYLTNSKVRGTLKETPIVAGQTAKVWGLDGTLNGGYKVHVTNNVTSTGTKGTSVGNCSHIWFGEWNQFVMASWGGVMIEKASDVQSRKDGQQTIIVTEFFDAAALKAFAFAAMLDALTTT